MENVLKEIRDAEAKAKKTIEDAERKKAEIVSKARHDSLKKINDEQARIDADKDNKVKSRLKDLEEMKDKIKKRGDAEADSIERKAKDSLSKTEDFILKRFEEKIGE